MRETRTAEKLTLGSGPAAHLAVKVNTDDLGALQLPRDTSHDVDGVGTTDTTSDHTETTGVGGVGVGTDHHETRHGVVLKNDLVDNTGSWLPETDTVLSQSEAIDSGQSTKSNSRKNKSTRRKTHLGAGRSQEVVDLLVNADSPRQVLLTTNLSLDQVVAVDRGRNGSGRQTSGHELQESHLGGGILASNTLCSRKGKCTVGSQDNRKRMLLRGRRKGTHVWAEPQVGDTTLDLSLTSVIQVTVNDLLGEGERAVEPVCGFNDAGCEKKEMGRVDKQARKEGGKRRRRFKVRHSFKDEITNSVRTGQGDRLWSQSPSACSRPREEREETGGSHGKLTSHGQS
jgi:hypothetical protein